MFVAGVDENGSSSLPESTTTPLPSMPRRFGEMLIDFVPTVSGVSLAEAPGFLKAPGGAPANVAIAVTRFGGKAAIVVDGREKEKHEEREREERERETGGEREKENIDIF